MFSDSDFAVIPQAQIKLQDKPAIGIGAGFVFAKLISGRTVYSMPNQLLLCQFSTRTWSGGNSPLLVFKL
jgi:hypothetical protein